MFFSIQKYCIHANVILTYQSFINKFYCSAHGATCSESGAVGNGQATRPLNLYQTELTGTTLRIYG